MHANQASRGFRMFGRQTIRRWGCLVLCAASGFSAASAHAALLEITDGDVSLSALAGLNAANVVQATAGSTLAFYRENDLTGGVNVTWQGIEFGYANTDGVDSSQDPSSELAKVTADASISFPGAGTGVPPFSGGSLDIGNSAEDDALRLVTKVFQSGGSGNIIFSSLTPGQTYRIDVLSFFHNANPRSTTLSYNGGPVDEYDLESKADTIYDMYGMAVADSNGQINVAFGNGDYPTEPHDETGAAWNAIIVSSIPEPASLMLIAAGLVGVTTRRRAG